MDKQTLANPYLDSAYLASMTGTDNGSIYFATAADIGLTAPFDNAAPNLQPASGSPATAATAKFDLTGTLDDAFFEKVSYLGAFDGTTDWSYGWAVFGK